MLEQPTLLTMAALIYWTPGAKKSFALIRAATPLPPCRSSGAARQTEELAVITQLRTLSFWQGGHLSFLGWDWEEKLTIAYVCIKPYQKPNDFCYEALAGLRPAGLEWIVGR